LSREAKAKSVVVVRESAERGFEETRIEGYPGGEEEGLVEAPGLRPVLGEEAALDGGERRLAADRRLVGARLSLGLSGDCREAGDRLVLEELLGGDEEARLPCPGDHLDREDRVAAQLEEVVVDPYPREPENPLPDLGEGRLALVPGLG